MDKFLKPCAKRAADGRTTSSPALSIGSPLTAEMSRTPHSSDRHAALS